MTYDQWLQDQRAWDEFHNPYRELSEKEERAARIRKIRRQEKWEEEYEQSIRDNH